MEDLRLAAAVLRDTTKMASWRNVAWYLGAIGFPEGFAPLRDFVWGSHAHGDPLLHMLDAMTSAQTSIGHIAGSSPQALRYLIESTNPAFWKSLPWAEPRLTEPELWLVMSEASIRALGMSGAPEAGQMLARLRQWPYKEAQRASIEEAMKAHRRFALERRVSQRASREISLYHLGEVMAPMTDSISLLGAWRWMRSVGWGAYRTPPACGWSRVLFFERDSTYSFWERDSVGEYRMCSGRFVLHTSETRPKEVWVELQGWSWSYPATFWLDFHGPDLLRLRPGSPEGAWHDIGLAHTLVRERGKVAPPDTIGAKEWRPPRICRSRRPSSHYIELPKALQGARENMGIRQYDLGHIRGLVPKAYEYTHFQIPAGVIGDFDGDSLADAAIYGYDRHQSMVACFISNGGSPTGLAAWHGPVSAGPNGLRPPSLYLKLWRRGQPFLNSEGVRIASETDGIYTRSANGEESILYYAGGGFHRGEPVSVHPTDLAGSHSR